MEAVTLFSSRHAPFSPLSWIFGLRTSDIKNGFGPLHPLRLAAGGDGMNDVSGARAAANQHHRSDPQSPQAAMISSSTLILVMLPFLIGVMTPTADGFPTNYCIISSYYLFTHQQKQQYHPSCATKLMISPPRSISLSQSPTRTISSRNIIGMMERRGTSTVSEMEAESNILREEIKELKKEALRRLEELSEQLTSTTTTTTISTIAKTSSPDTIPMATIAVKKTEVVDNLTLLPPPTPILFTSTTKDELDDLSTSSSPSNKEGEKKKKSTKGSNSGLTNLLDGTRWKVSLSIGREPGTWMPSTWGKSGSRINVSFVMDFTSSQLYDRDDFLRGSYAGCKVLHVVNNQATLGPTINEGARTYPIKDGGWRMIKGEGPMGTDLLRFYVEFDERVAHSGGDVDVPKGRVYCSCGYFPFAEGGGDGGGSAREAFTKELTIIEERIASLRTKKAEITNPFNFDGIKLSREIFRLNQQAEMINGKLMVASVREPDRRLLRFSKDGDVGLTKEGGVCIQVNKGPAIEYHILGRFGIASVDGTSMI